MTPLYPAEARLRNLTYETLLLVDVHKTAFNAVTNEPEGPPTTSQEQFGSIPLMVQSAYCRLKNMTDKDKTRFGECVFDQVRCEPLRRRVRDGVQVFCVGPRYAIRLFSPQIGCYWIP
jgi:DNA-directed RNA polymerase beta subunit